MTQTAPLVLVADDDPDIASFVVFELESAGFRTITASDGLAALRSVGSSKPDVVLLDIGLPKINGYEAARRIRGEPWGGNVALIALTGWGQDEDKRRSLEAGFDHHLTKPVEAAALERLLALIAPQR
jgi:CheY-like chemotaxis protein